MNLFGWHSFEGGARQRWLGLLDEIMMAEHSLGTRSWYARVASTSNIVDSPSRGDFELLTKLGSTYFEIDWDDVLASCSPK